MFVFMVWVAYQQGRYGCSSPSTKVLHDQPVKKVQATSFSVSACGDVKDPSPIQTVNLIVNRIES